MVAINVAVSRRVIKCTMLGMIIANINTNNESSVEPSPKKCEVESITVSCASPS